MADKRMTAPTTPEDRLLEASAVSPGDLAHDPVAQRRLYAALAEVIMLPQPNGLRADPRDQDAGFSIDVPETGLCPKCFQPIGSARQLTELRAACARLNIDDPSPPKRSGPLGAPLVATAIAIAALAVAILVLVWLVLVVMSFVAA